MADNIKTIRYKGKTYKGTEEQLGSLFDSLEEDSKKFGEIKNIPNRSFKSSGIAGVASDVIKDPSKAGETIKEAGTEILSEAIGTASGYTGGLSNIGVRKIEEKTGIDLPEPGVAGQIAGSILGPGKVARKSTEFLSKPGVVSPLVRGAAEGLVGGFLLNPGEGKELDPMARLKQAGVGVLFASALQPIATATNNIFKYFKTTSAIKNLNLKIKEAKTAKAVASNADEAKQQQANLKKLEAQNKALQSGRSKGLDDDIAELKNGLARSSEASAETAKRPLLRWSRNFKREWGNNHDELVNGSPNLGVKASEMKAMEKAVFDELDRLGIPKDSTPSKIIKNRMDQIKAPTRGTRSINPLTNKETISGAVEDSLVSNKELVRIRRDVQKALSASSKNAGQYTPEDLAGVIFNEKLGGMLSRNLGSAYKTMNQDYSKYSKFMQDVYKKFKLKDVETGNIPGSKMIERYVSGKATNQEKLLITRMEKRSGVPFTRKAKVAQEKLTRAEQAKVQKSIDDEIADIKTKQRSTKSEKEILKLESEVNDLESIKASVESVGTIARQIGTGTAVAVGTSVAIKPFLDNK